MRLFTCFSCGKFLTEYFLLHVSDSGQCDGCGCNKFKGASTPNFLKRPITWLRIYWDAYKFANEKN